MKNSPGGRPPKFDEPSRPVTLTLPESTLEALRHVDKDRGQAIVKLANGAAGKNRAEHPSVEIVEMAANTGLLVVGPCAALRRIPFLHLVEVAPSRFLLGIEPGSDFRSLEIAVQDILDDALDDKTERELLVKLLNTVKGVRKDERLSTAEMMLVRLDSKR